MLCDIRHPFGLLPAIKRRTEQVIAPGHAGHNSFKESSQLSVGTHDGNSQFPRKLAGAVVWTHKAQSFKESREVAHRGQSSQLLTYANDGNAEVDRPKDQAKEELGRHILRYSLEIPLARTERSAEREQLQDSEAASRCVGGIPVWGSASKRSNVPSACPSHCGEL